MRPACIGPAVGVAALLAAVVDATGQQLELPTPPLILEVPTAPRPFRREGMANLAYELHLTNLGGATLLVKRAEVLADDGAILAAYEGPEIAERLVRPVPALKLTDPRMIEGGRRAVLYLWLTFPESTKLPARLRHRVAVEGQGGPTTFTTDVIESGEVAIDRAPTPVIAPPVRGGRWVMRFVSNNGAHRRSLQTFAGRPKIMQRFAIDIGMMGDDGRQFKPEGSTNADMYGHDQELFAVADAIVADVQDGIPENDPNLPQPAATTPRAAYGNIVILDLGRGAFAFYGHIKPGSIRVKKGDRVRRGDVIARIGNTGSATGPHLHFQLMSSADITLADGLPYEFDEYRVEGIETMEQFEATVWTPDSTFRPHTVRRELPANGAVVRFRER